jgi:hypothetical protein
MRRDKAATRILLILSVIHVAAAAPATIRQRPLQSTKDVRTALEKRANSDDESSHPLPRMDNGLPPTSGTLPSQEPAPGDPELHSGPPAELGTPQLHSGPPAEVSGPPAELSGPPAEVSGPPAELGEDPQLHRLHGDQSPGWQHTTNLRPPGEMLQGESSGTAEIPSLHDDQSWDELHNYWNSYLRTLQDASSEPPPLRDHHWMHSQHNGWHFSWRVPQGESSEPPPLLDDQWGQHVNLASPGETLYQGSPGMSSTTSGVSDGRLQALGAQWLHDGGSEEVEYLYRRHDDAL